MLQVLSPKPHVDAMHGEPVLVANVEHCGDDVQHPILCSCRATHVYVGKNDSVEFTNALASLQPKCVDKRHRSNKLPMRQSR